MDEVKKCAEKRRHLLGKCNNLRIFVKNWRDMAPEIQTTLNRIISKSEVLLAKYRALEDEKKAVEKENEDLKKRLVTMTVELEKLHQEYEFLQIARLVSPTRESITKNQAKLAKLVQDMDKCISQLME